LIVPQLRRSAYLPGFQIVDGADQEAPKLPSGEIVGASLNIFIYLPQGGAKAINEGWLLTGHGQNILRLHSNMDAGSAI
jgi:hypothetical protein